MTLWGQLQNGIEHLLDGGGVYHNDPLGSTSELGWEFEERDHEYTIMTLWGQLQNEERTVAGRKISIP